MAQAASASSFSVESPPDVQVTASFLAMPPGSFARKRSNIQAGSSNSIISNSSHLPTTPENVPEPIQLAGHHVGQVPKHLGDDELPLTANRNGTWQSCMFHNVTAMVGAGVLGLPATFKYLSWAGGIVVLLAALLISWYTFMLLVHMHEVPAAGEDVEKAPAGSIRLVRLNRYIELSNWAFGERWGWIIQPFQIILLWGTAITYLVTGGTSLHAVYNNAGGDSISLSEWIVVFASVCVILSQVRNFGDLMLVSAMGAIVTAFYCSITVGMSASYPTEPRSLVSYSPLEDMSMATAVFGTMSAMTTVMFAFGGHNIALEIQASLPGGDTPENTTVPRMMAGVHVAFTFACIAYFTVTCTGFWAYGTSVDSNVIFSLGGPIWVQSLAFMLVFLHVVASFQVYSFPLHDMMEGRLLRYGIHMNWWRRGLLRTAYVAFSAFIGCLLPFFGDLMGLIGAIGITPTTYVFPCILWLWLRRPSWRTFDFWACWFIAISISCVGLLGAIGSTQQIIVSASSYKIFS